jgi:hypothetical protein
MCGCATATRRRRQARNGFKHIAKKQRSLYRVRDVAASARRQRLLVEKERMMQQRKGRSKKA